MPTVSPVQNADVQGAISRAATRTGVDFDYLLAQARLESGLDPSAKAQTSSASGLYQFIDSTWLRTLDRHGAKHGMDWADAAITPNGRVADTATRQHLLSLRYDADTSSLMAAELTRENAAGLRTSLGREAEPAELYLAHFLGLGGAQQFLGALGSNPDQSAAALMPRAARANRSIFYSGGSPRSVGEVMTLMRDKVSAAYGDMPMPSGGNRVEFDAARFAAHAPASTSRPSRGSLALPALPGPGGPRPSMADTLRNTFGEGGAGTGRANEHIAAAYGKFRALGL
ncbi:transglycosylase SLT domain-containing protein [Qipengyuania sp. SS22]|uniref:transglycosylase SLT domain-containing protein n=1 Tax=Qipengyuania sp. SS22 TaxID=2979461 RepID=UPI0021E54875|nr:transglycosylase SLT domain-containing protein [Qipengyuania sp. SS22]UYH54037.1 transglycosylase SLT domain-containing protein [Qipengyuania sp. SS22]